MKKTRNKEQLSKEFLQMIETWKENQNNNDDKIVGIFMFILMIMFME